MIKAHNNQYRPYSDEEIKFLRDNAPKYSYTKLAEMLNEQYGRKIRPETLCEYCRVKLGIDKHNDWGAKVGNTPKNTLPIGSEVVQKGKVVYVKVNNTGNRKVDWVVKSRIVYGSNIPKGCTLVFLDGDSLNVTKENLACVEQKVHARLAKNRWFSSNPDVTKAAIKWSEMLYAIKEIESDNRKEVTTND